MAAQNQKIEYLFAAQVTGQGQLEKLTMAVDSLRKEMDALKAAGGGVGAATQQYTRSLGNASSHVQAYRKHLDDQAKAMRNSRIGTMQAGMQVNDFVTSVSTGASPIQAFNQQIGQVGYAMQMMGGTAGKIGNFLAGPWSILVIGASMAVGYFVESLLKTEDGADKAKKATIDLSESFDFASASADQLRKFNEALSESNKGVAATAIQAANATAQHAAAEANKAQQDLNSAKALLVKENAYLSTLRSQVGRTGVGKETEGGTFAVSQQQKNINAQIEKNTQLQKSLDGLQLRSRKFAAESYTLSSAMDNNARATEGYNQRINDLQNKFTAGKISREQFTKSIDAENAAYKRLQNTVSATSRSGGSSRIRTPKMDKVKPEFSILGFYEEFFAKEFQQNDESLAKVADDQIKAILETSAKVSPEMQAIQTRTDELNQSFEAFGNSVSDAFKGMLTGAMSWKDGMRSLISSVIDQLWKLFVVQKIVGLVTGALGGATGTPTSFSPTTSVTPPSGFIPFNAYGGSVMGNKPTIVGERGPELFIPGGNGTIIPNGNVRGGGGGSPISINVDARGSSDPAAVRAQVQQGILEAAPAIIAAAESRTIAGLRRPRLGGAMQ